MKQRGDDYESTLSLLNVQNGHLLLRTSQLCSENFRPEDIESQFSAIPGTSFVGRRSLKHVFFFLIQTSERHTATDLVNFVYYPTGFV